MLRFVLAITMCLTFSSTSLYAQELVEQEEVSEFRLKNPDVDKYRFIRSFITALSYYHRVSERLRRENPGKEDYAHDFEIPQAFIELLIADNLDLRVAKGYLKKYLQSDNGLIRKITEETLSVFDDMIDINERERSEWEVLYQDWKGNPNYKFDYAAYNETLRGLLHERIDVLRRLPEVSIRAMVVTQSQWAKENKRKEFSLALTQDERDKLVDKLNNYAEGHLAWGMKDGQTSIEAAIAIIRERLEDPLWDSKRL